MNAEVDTPDTEETGICEVCLKETTPYTVATFDALEFLSCQECGTIFSFPVPTEDLTLEALNDSIYANKPAFKHNREKKHYLKHLEDIRDMTKGRVFLELNCRSGFRTELARMNGFKEALGADTNPYCIETAQKRFHKCNFLEKSLEDMAHEGMTYDVIYDSHGAEQAETIDGYVEAIKKLMHDKTLVYFMLCDGNHLMVPNSFLRWEELAYPERLRYISKAGFEDVLKRHGFKIVKSYLRFLPYQHVIAKLK